MSNKVLTNNLKGDSIYNPVLDKFENIDPFPKKTALVEEKLKGRNIRAEIEVALSKEKIK